MRSRVGAEEVGGAEVLVQVQEDSAFIQKRCCGSAECRGGAGGVGGAGGTGVGAEVVERWSRGGAEELERCRGGAE